VLDVVLLILKVGFLVLLYLFIYFVVRRASQTVLESAAPATPAAVSSDAAPEALPVSSPSERKARRAQRHADRTMPGESFDLSAHIEPRLVVVESPVLERGTVIPLEGWVTIGRAPSSAVVLDDEFVSQTHARVVPRGQLHFVEDLGSTNGTFVNGRQVHEAQLLIDAEIRIGETILVYEE
jgi:hypothetical protein